MKNKKFHITLIILLVWNFCFSQQFTNYATNEGLPSSHVYKVIQDTKGFIWIATDKGLVKYNGTNFKTFTTKDGLATNDVWDLYASPDGKIWYQSKASKVGYVENDSVYAFESEEKGEILYSLFTSQINNNIVLSDGKKTFQLANKNWKKISDNKLHAAFSRSYIQNKNISHFVIYGEKDSLVFFDKNKKPVATLKDNELLHSVHKRGQLTDSLYYWITDSEYRIINLNTLKVKTHSFKDEINIENAQHARINFSNNAFQVSGRGFVSFLDKDFHLINTYYFPKEIDAHFGYIDASENIWLCTFSNGIYKLPKTKRDINYVLNYKKVNYLDFVNGKLVATVYNDGFYVFGEQKSNFTKFLPLSDFLYPPTFLKEINTEFYISNKNIVTVIDGSKKSISFINQLGRMPVEVDRNVVYHNNHIYGVNSFGINKLESENLSVLKSYRQLGINSIVKFNDKLIVATTNGIKQFVNEKFVPINFSDELANKSILSINQVSDTEVLLNTDGFGAYISDLKTCKQLPNSEYLIVNNAFVNDNLIWLATNKGVLKYTKTKNDYLFTEVINTSNGLPSQHVNDVLVHHNKIFVSTNSGLVILPENYKHKNQLLDIYIENATYNTLKIQNKSSFLFEENNNIVFEIATIDYSENANNLEYEYKLYPIQKQWIATSSNNISFNSLLPGEYVLRIKSQGIIKKIQFKIIPLWWQTLFVKLLALFVFLCLLIYVVYYLSSMHSKKEKNKILLEQKFSELQLSALRSQMNPHFVFNALSAIQFYINENDFITSEYYLVRFSKLIRQFFEISKKSSISIADEMELLSNYLDIEKLRFKDKLDYKFNVDENLNNHIIPTMLLQPIVENAINHGIFNKLDKGLVTINVIKLSDSEIKIEIIDDGVGFDKTKKNVVKVKSSEVLTDRIHFLNITKVWKINYDTEIPFPDSMDIGNKSIFIIQKL